MVKIPTDLWVPALMKPKETFSKANKGKAVSLGDAAIVVGAAGLISGLIGALTNSKVGLVEGVIGGAIGGIIGSMVFAGLVWGMAKVLGGKGEYGRQYYLYSLFGAPVTVINSVLGLVPFIGGLLSGLLSLYMLYPLTVSIKEVHKLDTVKAVLAWLVPVIIIAVILALVGAAIATMMLASGTFPGQ